MAFDLEANLALALTDPAAARMEQLKAQESLIAASAASLAEGAPVLVVLRDLADGVDRIMTDGEPHVNWAIRKLARPENS